MGVEISVEGSNARDFVGSVMDGPGLMLAFLGVGKRRRASARDGGFNERACCTKLFPVHAVPGLQ